MKILSTAVISHDTYEHRKGRTMEEREITLDDLERLAMAMAQKIPEIDCPECCDCGWSYQYIELSARLYQDEWEWACLSETMVRYRLARQSGKKISG